MRIVECSNGREAVKAFIDECVLDMRKAFIFMDIEMPFMDGIQATLKIRSYHTMPQPIIVAVTAYDTTVERDKCAAARFDHFYPKPLLSKSVKQHVEALLSD